MKGILQITSGCLLALLLSAAYAQETGDTPPLPEVAPETADTAGSASEDVDPAEADQNGEASADDPAGSSDEEAEASEPGETSDEDDADTQANETEEEAGPSVPEGLSQEEFDRCRGELDALDVIYTLDDPVAGENQCGIAQPVDVSSIGPVIVEGGTQLTCDSALALAKWVEHSVVPATDALGDGIELTHLENGSTYVCRMRNNGIGAKPSWHGMGRAIDVMGFRFEGHEPISIVPRSGKGTIEEAFQRAVRAGGCLYFTTVLGPGSDEYHNDHLHLDTAIRNNDYRLCQ